VHGAAPCVTDTLLIKRNGTKNVNPTEALRRLWQQVFGDWCLISCNSFRKVDETLAWVNGTDKEREAILRNNTHGEGAAVRFYRKL
jgi:predicted Fe-S protein YdhL (DUF1289 family)